METTPFQVSFLVISMIIGSALVAILMIYLIDKLLDNIDFSFRPRIKSDDFNVSIGAMREEELVEEYKKGNLSARKMLKEKYNWDSNKFWKFDKEYSN